MYKSKDQGWIGTIRLHRISKEQRTAELGIMIGDRHQWGKGFGTDACTLLLSYVFGKMNLNRVGIGVVSLNARAIALWERLGFKEEGRHREAFWVDGLPRDVIRMGLLQREWFDAHPGSGTSKTG
jgi:RimJ/RimL family protein N-acetyltransferase